MTLPTKPIRSLRPTLETPFHIDYEWWNKGDRDLRVYLRSHLCAEHREQLADANLEGDLVDSIDPVTAEVKRVDALVLLMARPATSPGASSITWRTARTRRTAGRSNTPIWRASRAPTCRPFTA